MFGRSEVRSEGGRRESEDLDEAADNEPLLPEDREEQESPADYCTGEAHSGTLRRGHGHAAHVFENTVLI